MTLEMPFARTGGVPCGLTAESRRAISAETDLDLAVAWLQRRYPDLCIWWGEYTGSIWALLPDQLVEAKNALALARHIDTIRERSVLRRAAAEPVQRANSLPRTPHGAWTDRSTLTPPAARRYRPTAAAKHEWRGGLLRRLFAGGWRILFGEAGAPQTS
ncbi:hypothetical protein E1200_04950 [Actinomadura sp. GC306]|uniref:hypothetical protein n=1 Tax=Actinomadura sp. GC306 TaxID=2530367 RepID=UPI00104C82B8|nr:hypothetical protein [Actinomadura sp. GC306]TDC70587.1 hypothetical protein E1200_04950 [Actinomadura sp. GC306]